MFVDLSIGIAVAETSGHASPEDALRLAGELLARAEEDMHRRRTGTPAAVPDQEHRSREHLRLETDLRGAVDRGEIAVHLQPQVDLASGQVVGVEALARWHHPALGSVRPDVFVPIAEASGQIRGIGDHVLREACRTVAAWRAD